MLVEQKRRYDVENNLPYLTNLERFAPPYSPEQFTPEEQYLISPFFSNLDRPVFLILSLPEEVKAALVSRYSRNINSLRRTFLNEYVMPILHPEEQKGWDQLEDEHRKISIGVRQRFLDYVKFLHENKGLEEVVNVQRGRKFFETWLAEFGDDSISEEGQFHLCLEGTSNIVQEEIVDKRIGLSPLIKSSRYVPFDAKRLDGQYQFIIPGELKGTAYEEEYKMVMNLLFGTYASISGPYLEYIKEKYPQDENEPARAFNNSRSAKRFDDIRELLPLATQTNIGLAGNARAFEDLVNRLLDHPIGEIRWWGKEIIDAVKQVAPSLISRPQEVRGARVQVYKTNLQHLRQELAGIFENQEQIRPVRWANLVSCTRDADVAILSTYLMPAVKNLSLDQIKQRVHSLDPQIRYELLGKILKERKLGDPEASREQVRFRKVPRAFENAHYLFEIWGRAGDYRDLHRHRQNTQERQSFTTKWGYDLDRDLQCSPFIGKVDYVLKRADQFFRKLEQVFPEITQYVVPMGFIQHWYMNLSAREIYWMVELRTGPQGRPHYREICQQIAQQAIDASPAVFQGMMVDWNDYSLSRRESEIKADAKLANLGVQK